MRDIEDIKVTHAIAHQVSADQQRLSDVALDLDDAIKTYLATHIIRGLNDQQAKAATFNANSGVGTTSLAISRSARDFISRSHSITAALYDIVQRDRRIAPATFVVARASGTLNGQPQSIVALLKLDPAGAYRTITRNQDGQIVVKLQAEKNVLPSENERIQKCAFISEGAYNCLVVDRQTHREVQIADFFMRFLGVEFYQDSKQRTIALARGLHEIRRNFADRWSTTDMNQLDRQITATLQSAAIDTQHVIQSFTTDPTERAEMTQILNAALPDRTFNLDEETSRAMYGRVTYEGDNRLRVSVQRDFLNMIRTSDDPNDPDVTIVEIRTRKWQPKI